jgi:hypothetical protein
MYDPNEKGVLSTNSISKVVHVFKQIGLDLSSLTLQCSAALIN